MFQYVPFPLIVQLDEATPIIIENQTYITETTDNPF
jgi:hypothetical protein